MTLRRSVCVLVAFEHRRPGSAETVTRYLTTSRRGRPDDIGFPGGKVEPGEDLRAAAARELYEETGLPTDPMLMEPLYTAQHGREGTGDVWEATLFIPVLGCVASRQIIMDLGESGRFEREPGIVVRFATEEELTSPSCCFRDWNLGFFEFLKAQPRRSA